MSNVKDMTSGNPLKLMFFFALPLMIGNVGQQLYMIADAIIVGRGVGVQALAALGATDWIYCLVLWILMFFAQGFSILITQRFGAGDEAGVKKAISMSMLLCLIIGSVLTVLSLVLAKPMLILLKTPDDILTDSLSYLTVLFSGTMVVLAYNLAASILRAFGNGKSPLIAMIIASVFNIVLDLLFVMVLGWGIIGAAVATVISQGIACGYCVLVLRKIPQAKITRENWKVDSTVVKKLLSLGAPLALQHGFIAVGGMILQSVINGFGFVFVAGFTATNKLYGILESSASSFGFAASTYMGQNRGAQRFDRIDNGIKSIVKLSVLVSIGITALVLLFGKQLLTLFVSTKEQYAQQVLSVAWKYLRVMSICLSPLYLLHTYRSALQGLGVTIPSLISGIIEFFMRIGAALILPLFFGSTGLFFAEPAAWAGAAIYLIFAYYHGIKTIKLTEGIS